MQIFLNIITILHLGDRNDIWSL